MGTRARRPRWPLVAAVICCWFAYGPPVRAAKDEGEDEFERTAVRIGCYVNAENGQLRLAGTGSGFLIGDQRHLVTNTHVVRSQPCMVGMAAVMNTGKPVRLKVLAYSDVHDLAVLEAETALAHKEPVRALMASANIASRDEVFVIGFPAIVDSMAADNNMLRPTTTRGIIGRKIETSDGVRMLQVDARTIGGNSGGPWLNACGALVGIHSRGSYQVFNQGVDADGQARVESLPVGYGYAIQTDHLVPLLKQAKITYQATSSCSLWSRNATGLGWTAGLLLGGGLLLRYTGEGRRLWGLVTGNQAGQRDTSGGPGAKHTGPHLVGLSGALRGITVDFGEHAVVIGRDARVSNLVLPAERDDISKRHCLVRFDPDTDQFLLEDCWSTNGTFLASGERLPPGTVRRLDAGDRFYLADAAQMFELRHPGQR